MILHLEVLGRVLHLEWDRLKVDGDDDAEPFEVVDHPPPLVRDTPLGFHQPFPSDPDDDEGSDMETTTTGMD